MDVIVELWEDNMWIFVNGDVCLVLLDMIELVVGVFYVLVLLLFYDEVGG